MKYLEKLRGSGRTTRMIMEAVDATKNKLSVCIVVPSGYRFNFLQNILDNSDWEEWIAKCIKTIQIKTFNDVNVHFDPFTAQISFLGKKYDKVFIDHYAIEERFSALLNELHRFDKD